MSGGITGDMRAIQGPARPLAPLSQERTGDRSFREILSQSLAEVNTVQQDADRAVEALFTGQTDNFGEVMAAVEKADLAFRTLMQMRNKLIAAYEEISRLRM